MLNRRRNSRILRLSDYAKRLELAGVGNGFQEALWLAEYALSEDTAHIIARREFSPEEAAKIEKVIARREAGEPLQYITGVADFYGRDFHVGFGVLIPRHDTETLIQAVVKHFARYEAFTFTDWGTGSGCIAVSILLEFPKTYAYLVEASPDARRYAEMNLRQYGLTDRAEFVADGDVHCRTDGAEFVADGDVHCRTDGAKFSQTLPKCTLTISNPPYIPTGEINGLMKSVREYEPVTALDGGDDGMNFYREIFAKADSDCIILETGNIKQVHALKTMADKYICCDEVRDAGNFPRCLVFTRRAVHEKT